MLFMPQLESPPSRTSPFRAGLIVWVATGGWVGLIPWAPGTFGSLLGIPLALAVAQVPDTWLQAVVLTGVALAGVPICALAVRRLGGPHDPGCVVFDEIVGMAATLFSLPLDRPEIVVGGYLLFRLFDITKPTPVRQVERLPHGWGIMADDLVAAVYAHFALRLLIWAADMFFAGSATG